MNLPIHFFKIVVLIPLLISCRDNCNIKGIEVGELLNSVSKEQSINYCELLESATDGDNDAIRKLSLLDFSDGAGYEHGEIIVDLIIMIGEKKYIAALGSINDKQKEIVKSYLEVGLSYSSNAKIKSKNLKVAFPMVSQFME